MASRSNFLLAAGRLEHVTIFVSCSNDRSLELAVAVSGRTHTRKTPLIVSIALSYRRGEIQFRVFRWQRCFAVQVRPQSVTIPWTATAPSFIQ